MDQFLEISLLLLIAFLVATVVRLLKQPLVIGYILTGLIVGPSFLNILKHVETVELFSRLGITSLLFIVGLGLSPKVLKELGVVSAVTGVGQVLFTSFVGYLIAIALGFSTVESLYIAVALTFSSTIIILKLLSDKGDTSKLYGKIAIGFLLVQDLIATIILVVVLGLSTVDVTSGWAVASDLGLLLLKGAILLAVLFILASKLLTKLTDFVAKSQEFLFMFSIAWGMAIASFYHELGLSIEIGALVAGITLSVTPYAHEVSSRLKPLRDFFITLFFILLGSQMMFHEWQSLVVPTLLFSSFILIGNPLIVLVLMNLLGYTRKTAFMAGLTVAQISEFSLILVQLGRNVGHLPENVLSMVTLVGIITIAGSTYMILYSDALYKKIEKALAFFEFRKAPKEKAQKIQEYDAIIFGYRRAGPEFAHAFRKSDTSFLVVDFNPDTIHRLNELKIPCQYGDASDVDFLQELPLATAKTVVSSSPDFETNLLLTQVVRKINPDAVIVVITDTMEHAISLYDAGVSSVVLSHYIGAKFAAEKLLDYGYDSKKYEKDRTKHIKYLKGIKELSFQP